MKALLPVLVLLMLCDSAAFADKIYLKNGKILKTAIIKEDEQSIMVENGDSWQKINKSEIELIRKGDQAPTAPNPPAPAPVKPAAPAQEITLPSRPVAEKRTTSAGIGIFSNGVVVTRVMPDSPASDAGVLKGDSIIAVDGESTLYSRSLKERLRGPAGTQVTIEVLRTGAIEPIEITMTRENLPRTGTAGIEQRQNADPVAYVHPEPEPEAEMSEASPSRPPQGEGMFRVSYDFAGSHAFNGTVQVGNLYGTSSSNEDVTGGTTLTGEYVSYVDRNVGLGFGAAYQLPRKMTKYSGNFYFLPVYGLLKIRTAPDAYKQSYYAVGQLGYNLFYGDSNYKGTNGKLENGIYYGVGAGMTVGGMQFELLYTVNNGSFKDSGLLYSYPYYYSYSSSGDIKYSKITLSVGISL